MRVASFYKRWGKMDSRLRGNDRGTIEKRFVISAKAGIHFMYGQYSLISYNYYIT